jgi:lysozyme
MSRVRVAIGALALSAAGFTGLLVSEGYMPVARPPLRGDVNTYGFGTTTNEDGSALREGQTIAPPQAVARALRDVQAFEGALKTCVFVPLYQWEYDAYVELTYNIGAGAFCSSTLVRLLNAQRYEEACAQILRWNRFQGQENRGLTVRREREYAKCMGTAK